MTVDRSLKKLTIEILTMKIGRAESPLASFLFVLSFYGETLGGRGFVMVLSTIALQAPLDRARGELPSDTRTLIFHIEIFRRKNSEIWRSEIASISMIQLLLNTLTISLTSTTKLQIPHFLENSPRRDFISRPRLVRRQFEGWRL